MEVFKYGQSEINYLKNADKMLGTAIEKIGMVEREVIPDLFTALINAVVGQQISTKAAKTIWSRMQEHFGEITPNKLSEAKVDQIQKLGMTTRKAGYIKNISDDVAQGSFNLKELYKLSDTEVINRLCSLNGIGIWTAEMLLLHSMQRPDIVSFGDIAIRRGMMKLYDLETLSKKQFEGYRQNYSPYGSVASIYLWKLSIM